MVLAHEVEGFLERCRQDLILISQEKPHPAKLRDFLAKNRRSRGILRNRGSGSSPRSPLWVYPARSPQVLRYSYLFDTEGWILFQSEGSDKGDTELKTDLVRSVFTGTMGMPNLPCGFSPGAAFGNYWKMVEDIREGKQGLIKIADPDYELSGIKEYYLAYTPVRFIPGQDTLRVLRFSSQRKLSQDVRRRIGSPFQSEKIRRKSH